MMEQSKRIGEPKRFARDAKRRGRGHITLHGRSSPVRLWANRGWLFAVGRGLSDPTAPSWLPPNP